MYTDITEYMDEYFSHKNLYKYTWEKQKKKFENDN